MMACEVCNELSSNEPAFWNEPLFESANFFVLPSLGALVEGWLLLLPKQHAVSMGALGDELIAEMQYVKNLLVSAMGRNYPSVCAFEHGPSKANSLVGCGVDHAHLHVVPLAFDLADAAAPFLPCDASWERSGWDHCRVAFRAGKDYLYLEQPIGSGRIAVHDSIGSQVFRKAIAARVGIPEQFNWREYPRLEVASRTIRCFHRIVNVEPEHLSGAQGLA